MTAIFTGLGAGFARGSATVLGSSGLLGSSSLGRGGDNVMVNAATGNLVITRQDEFLVGRGPDAGISRTYNSLAEVSDRDNEDQWQMSTARRVYGFTGTLNAADSTIKRQGGDGSVVTYTWDTGKSAYVATDGDGAHDKLVKSSATTWTWTDGSSQVTETYEQAIETHQETGVDPIVFRIKEQTDTDGNKLTFAYFAGTDKLYRVTTFNDGTANVTTGVAEQSYVQYFWSNNNLGNDLESIVTGYTDYGPTTGEGDNVNKTLTRTRYGYDASHRLTTVTVDLSPENNSVTDGKTYVTTYTYDGTSDRVASITQDDGSSLAIVYDASGRVMTLTQAVAPGDTRVTTLAYGTNYTTVTGPDQEVTRLDYDASKRLTRITLPTAETLEFGYDASGNVKSVTDSAGETNNYTYDAWGNQLTSTDPLLNVVSRTYGAKNEVLSETRTGTDAGGTAVSHTTRYVYDAENHLHYVVSAEDRVTEYRYTVAGQLQYEIAYPEHPYTGTEPLSESALNTWRNLIPDRSSTTIRQYVYDGRDNLSARIDYGSATSAGVGATTDGYRQTNFTYDQAGNLLTRYVSSLSPETFVYDGLGRLVASTDLSGGTTTYRFVDATTTTIVHLATGLTRTLVYNKAGDLVSETASTPGYQPDELYADLADWSYVRMTRTAASPIGGEDAYTYTMDATGTYGAVTKGIAVAAGETVTWRITVKGNPADVHRIGLHGSTEIWGTIAATDASAIVIKGPGSISNAGTYGALFDLTGLSETQETVIELRRTYTEAQSASANFYVGGTGGNVPAGMTVTLAATNLTKTFTDANEGISSTSGYLYDENGRLRVATDATGFKTYYLYDEAGRKIADVNHYGGITEYRYDAAGRVAATIRYANTVDVTQFDTPSEEVELADIRPAAHGYDIWQWSVYDDAGRLVESIDGDGGVAVYSYDGSDRLVKTLRYYDKLTASQLAELKSALSAVPPELPTPDGRDAVTRSFYDGDGRLIGALDGEGYLTEIVYDAAGRKVEEIAYAAKVTLGAPATDTFATLRGNAGPGSSTNRRMHYVYDGQNFLRYAVDNAGYVTQYLYPNDVLWSATGLVRGTIVHAAPISTTDFTYDNVKTLVAGIASDTNDRESYSVINAKGQVAYSVDARGQVTGFAYDIAGRVTKSVQYAVLRATPSLPTVATMDEWAAGQASNTANRVTRNWYAAGGNLRFTVDGEGYARRFDYDAEGRLTREVTWANKVAATDATTIAQIGGLTSGAGTWTDVQYTYDAAGRRNSVYDGEGNRTLSWFYGNDQSSSDNYAYDTDDLSRTVYGYDGAGRTTRQFDAYPEPEQTMVQHTFDGIGNLASVTDANGRTTTYTYDRRGLLKQVTDAANGTVSYEYNAFGEVVKTTDARGGKTCTWYDDLGRVKATAEQFDTVAGVEQYYLTTTTYTDFGEVESVKRWATAWSGTPNPAAAPPTVAAHANDAVTQFQYDKRGQLKQTIDAEGFIESYTYNAFGERDSATAKSETALNADRTDNLTTYAYDRRGLLVSETLPMSSVSAAGATLATTVTNSFEYDARGNRIKETTAVGLPEQTVTQYLYDKANRLIERIDPTYHTNLTPHTYYAYDARGNHTRKTDPAGYRTIYFYDDLDRVSVEINAAGTYTAYTYDPNGNVTSIKVYETAVAVPADGGSQEEQPAAPSGSFRETTFTYDNLNRMTKSSVLGATTGSYTGSAWTTASTAIETLYEYDAAGNVVKTADPNGNATWAWYDKLGRKTDQVDALGYRTHWTYDAEGNVVQERRYWNVGAIPTGTATPPALPATHADDRITGYTYDRMGNRLTETRLNVKVFDPDGGANGDADPYTDVVDATVAWSYNGLGQVTSKTEAAEAGGASPTNSYLYDDAGRLIEEKRAGFVGHTGAAVVPEVDYGYDGLGNLVRTVAAGTAGVTEARTTTYGYEGGKLRWMGDAEYNDGTSTDGKLTYYWYDLAGNLQYEYYARRDASGTLAGGNELEGVRYVHDGLGRVTQQWLTVNPVGAGSWAQDGPATLTAYNAWGEVKSVQVGSGALQQNTYDAAGRLIASNAGDGVWKYFGYDKNGNRTLAIASAGEAFTASTPFAQALAKIGESDVDATYTVYDARGLATQVIEEGRQLSAADMSGPGQTLLTERAYNAYREVAWELAPRLSGTSAPLEARTNYTYNTMGRVTRQEGPAVWMVEEDGDAGWIKPSQDYYYDRSGRLVATRDAGGASGDYTLGATSATAGSKAANKGHLTRLTLLAGTGYGGSQALVTDERHADGGRKQTLYDIHGDARVIRDEIYAYTGLTDTNDSLHFIEQEFDQRGEVIKVKHKRWADTALTDDTTRLVDHYEYDALGQQIRHWNSLYGSGNAETTDYDVQGRVISAKAFGGHVTNHSYAWDATSLTATAVGSFGGWVQTTTHMTNGKTETRKIDLFGREVSRTNVGGSTRTHVYDVAGRMTSDGQRSYAWFNTGELASTRISDYTESEQLHYTGAYMYTRADLSTKTAAYSYDAAGNRVGETTSVTTQTWYFDRANPATTWNSTTGTSNIDEHAATYDALGRLLTWQVAPYGAPGSPTAKAGYDYDANGNIRHVHSETPTIDASGNYTTAKTIKDHWFAYDTMNRVVVERGMLSGGVISAGTTGMAFTYFTDGLRQSEQHGAGAAQTYTYDGAGRLQEIKVGGTRRSVLAYDAMGRIDTQSDYEADGVTVAYSRNADYDGAGRIATDDVSVRKARSDASGYDTLRTVSTYDYGTGASYAFGNVLSIAADVAKNGVDADADDTLRTYTYTMGGTLVGDIWFDADTGDGTNSLTLTRHNYNGRFEIDSIGIGGSPASAVAFGYDVAGQIVSRTQTGSGAVTKREAWYVFDGREIGYIGNDGTDDVSLAASIAERQAATPASPGYFRNGTTSGSYHSDFAQGLEAINSYGQGAAGGSYTARAGDTLQSLAAQVWGDASLWYKLAEANGLGAAAALFEGQTLTIPAGVQRNTHSAGTFQPYDPAERLGDLAPGAPRPKGKNCGVMGQILLAVVAVAVAIALPHVFTALAPSAFGGGIIGGAVSGAIGGAAGSVVSQGVGLATGIQQDFSFKGVALAALGGAVGGGLGGWGDAAKVGIKVANKAGLAVSTLDKVGAFLGSGGVLGTVARGLVSGAATQGIAYATGLQDKFSWAGVAAAGVGAAASWGAGALGGNQLIQTAASGIAQAATRSAITGNSFGDSLIAQLPDIIGQAVGGAIAGGVAGGGSSTAKDTANGKALGNPVSKNGGTDTVGEAYSDLVQYSAEERAAMLPGRIETIDIPASTVPSAPPITWADAAGAEARDGRIAGLRASPTGTPVYEHILQAYADNNIDFLKEFAGGLAGQDPDGAPMGLFDHLDSQIWRDAEGIDYSEMAARNQTMATVRDVLADVAGGDAAFAMAIAADLEALDSRLAKWIPDAPMEYDPIGDIALTGGLGLGKSAVQSVGGLIARGIGRTSADDLLKAVIPWGKGNHTVGTAWEDHLASSMPHLRKLDGPAGSPYFLTFDFFDNATGTAISAKTIDLFGTSFATKPNAVYRKLEGYIDKAASFTQYQAGGFRLTSSQITARQIQLAIPDGASSFQMLQVARGVSYGRQQGVEVIVSRVPR